MMPSELPQDQGQVSEDEGVAMESHKQALVNGLDKCTTTLEEDAQIDISEIGEEYQHDPHCDPDNPIQVKFQDVSAAAYKIKSGVFRSPCSKSNLSTMVGMDLYLKKDYLQTTGSFKERGARNTLLMLPEVRNLLCKLE
ncbi:uncharacterized protein LOC135155974 [Lytechinus pictus]|uniref:uncharacterized protein LOC135155974 n=1 Tax=Lytechinus pictus TaxID=7653 RepID=UPI0030B9FC9E